MPNPGTELASLDFGNLIGSPLVAVITAQSIAARATIDFIKTVGFDDDNKPVYVDFTYPKEINPYQPAIPADGTNPAVPAVPATYQDMKFSVPILALAPIPFIKVDLFTLDFNAKITSMETRTESTEASISGNLEVKQRWPGGSAKLNVAAAYKKTTATGSSVERTYSMAIHVQASQDEMPAGMEKLLNILEGAMISKPL
jgi:hypothetical protein